MAKRSAHLAHVCKTTCRLSERFPCSAEVLLRKFPILKKLIGRCLWPCLTFVLLRETKKVGDEMKTMGLGDETNSQSKIEKISVTVKFFN